ncbi:MAG: tetratricopeptide repeat protein [Deltaproteobacteria bacterium]
MAALRDEVASLRRERMADRKRLEALENQFDAQQAELSRLRGMPQSSAELVPSDLEVVHLRAPKASRSARMMPRLPTDVPVREPSADDLAALEQAVPSPGASASADSPDVLPDALYDGAFEKLKTGDLLGAASDFEAFAQRFPKNPAADNALLDQGIALYGLHRYDDALRAFSRIESRYPAGDALPEALWRSADCDEKLGRPADAKRLYAHLTKDFPDSPEGRRAKDRLARPAEAVLVRDEGDHP